MATVYATSNSESIVNFASGSFTGSGADTAVTLGFVPRYFKLINATDLIVFEKTEGMAAANCLSADSEGALALETGTLIGFGTNGVVTVKAAVAASAKAISWVAFG